MRCPIGIPVRVLGLLVAGAAACPVVAGTLDQVKLAVHARTSFADPPCRRLTGPSRLACDSPESTSALRLTGEVRQTTFVYVMALDVPPTVGVSGAAFGIAYSASVYVFSTWLCADRDIHGPGWPASGSSNVILFDTAPGCPGTSPGEVDPTDPQGEAVVALYWFYLYAYGDGVFEITQRNDRTPPDFTVTDCSGSESSPEFPRFAGRIGFGSESGYSPCVPAGAIPVRPTSWGAVKRRG